MCFSAQASFTTSAFLTIIGLISIRKAQSRAGRFLALTPLFFAVQQCAEGVLWLELAQQSLTLISQFALYTFLFFAFIFWPIWIPLTTTLVEKDSSRKKLLVGLLGIGVLTAALFIWFIPLGSVSAEAVCSHIYYNLHLPDSASLYNMLVLLYLSAVALPLLVSTVPYLWMFGSALLASYVITYIFYRLVLVSVWCFFAAVISSFILYIITKNSVIYKKN